MTDVNVTITPPVEINVSAVTSTSATIIVSDAPPINVSVFSGNAIEYNAATTNYAVEVIESRNAFDSCNTGGVSLFAVYLYNGIALATNVVPTVNDMLINTSSGIIGIPVIPATNDSSGAVRIKVNGVVKALQKA